MQDKIEHHLPALWRFALVITRDHEAAKELVQAACLRALEKADNYQPGTKLDRWLMTLMMNVWRNELRSQKVRLGAGVEDAENVLSFDGGSRMETNIFASQVLTAVSKLPEAQRDAVLMVYLEGWSYAEASIAAGVPIGTIMSRLAAARSSLANMKPDMGEIRALK